MKVGIIGMGWVGSSVAISLLHQGMVRELLLCDAKPGLAEGEAMDLAHGQAFYPSAKVRAVELDQLRATDAVVIAAGRGGAPGESRLELLQDTAHIARTIGRELRGYGGLIVVVTNPVDVLTQIVTEASDLPPSRVIGTGTLLDTSRLRHVLGRQLGLNPRSVHAQVVGEHGDSEVVLWSGARVGGRSVRDWPAWNRELESAIAAEVRHAAQAIITRKGATNHAIGLVTAYLLQWASRDARRILTVSCVQSVPELPELDGIAISLPAVVGDEGVSEIVVPEMESSEREGLLRSAEVLRRARLEVE